MLLEPAEGDCWSADERRSLLGARSCPGDLFFLLKSDKPEAEGSILEEDTGDMVVSKEGRL